MIGILWYGVKEKIYDDVLIIYLKLESYFPQIQRIILEQIRLNIFV